MISIAGGFIAAVFFASSSLLNSRASRHISGWSVVAWAMLVGLVLTAPLAALSGIPDSARSNVGWLVVAGVGNVGGLVLAAYAFRWGKVGVVAPILATEGALAAVIAARLGESLAPNVVFLLVVIMVGVVLAAGTPDPFPLEHERLVLSSGLAVCGAVFFGVSLYAMAHLSGELPISWVLLPARVVGVLALTVPLVLSGRLQINRRVAPLVLGMGSVEVLGIAVFSWGARENIAIASVLSSQFAPLAAIMAYLLFRERLGRVQIVGVIVIVAGVSGLTVWG